VKRGRQQRANCSRSLWMTSWARWCILRPSWSRNALGERIDSHPEPKHPRMTTQVGTYFIQLRIGPCELTEGSLMQVLSMLSCLLQPPRGSHAQCQIPAAPQIHQVLRLRQPAPAQPDDGCFQPRQRGMEVGRECRAAGRTSKGLDALNTPRCAIPGKSVNVSIGDT
jgi:hypothetical protein